MQGNSQQQAYDRGTNIFSPDGRLYQVEYAREAVKRGSPTVGVRTGEGVVFVTGGRLRSPLQVAESIEKIHKADDHVGIASAGHVADARQLVDVARRQAQVERLRFEEPASIEALTKEVTGYIQEYTQAGGARPFGAALLLGGVDPDGTPRLFETDPSGTPYEWAAVAIGGDSAEIQDYLEENYDEGLDSDGGLELALRALASVNDGTLDAEGMSAAVVNGDGYRQLSGDELHTTIDDHGLAETEADE
ncbi:archaeal proteasome endopeptidase complex subunit alpha [Halorarius halobius]|uniref:archaeal proteasome endopeptidase complex subunit alpha n=1 Tax=Halorarius halobius TaxID=2962671 RepID=UPI0020CC39CC|nr:archaeal proteasome endopeptidase complex subunit alpha [Halorarius halobius]